MKCNQCQEDKSEGEFLLRSPICCSCKYQNNLKALKKPVASAKVCKICNQIIPKEKLIYWKSCYCSDDCAREGKNQYNKNYWIHNFNAPKVNRKIIYGKPKQV